MGVSSRIPAAGITGGGVVAFGAGGGVRRVVGVGVGLMLASLVGAEPCWRGWVVQVLQVLDGPAVEVEVTWEPGRTAVESVRVLGLVASGEAARAFAMTWLAGSGPTELIVCRPARDAQGRLQGRVRSVVRGDLGAAMLAAGHGHPDP